MSQFIETHQIIVAFCGLSFCHNKTSKPSNFILHQYVIIETVALNELPRDVSVKKLMFKALEFELFLKICFRLKSKCCCPEVSPPPKNLLFAAKNFYSSRSRTLAPSAISLSKSATNFSSSVSESSSKATYSSS